MSFCNRQILDLPAPKRNVPLCLSARMGLSWQRLHPTSHSPFRKGSAQQWVLISDGEPLAMWMVSRAEAGVNMSPGPSSQVMRHFPVGPGRAGRLLYCQEAASWAKGSSQQRQQRENWYLESPGQQPQPRQLPCVRLSLVFNRVALLSAFWLLVPILDLRTQ